MSSRALLAVTGLVLSAGLSACSSDNRKAPSMDLTALESRPRTEEVLARYAQVQTSLRAQIDEVAGTSGWTTADDASDSGCPGDADPRGQVRSLDSALLRAPVPDGTWPAVVAALTPLLEQSGFGAPRVVVDQPGNHQLEASDELGGFVRLISQQFTLISFTTGCLLPADGAGAGTTSVP